MVQGVRARRPGVVLAMLLLVYTLNFLDRQVLGILAEPIKADLQLSDTEFGAIGGLAFALLYSLLGVPLGYLADRTSRSGVITAALVAWSGFTALCGTASGYGQLFLYRLGVGMGEAGGVAPSYALIADYFPPERRARMLGIYSLGIPIGLSTGTLAGAYIAALLNWRAAFLILGLAGLAVAPLVKLWVVDPVRPQPLLQAPSERPAAAFAILARKPAFWLMAFASSCSSLCGYGLALWTPSVLMRSYGLDLVTTGRFAGSMLLVGGVVGVVGGGWLADRLGRRDRGWYAKLPGIAWLLAAPTFAAGLLMPTPGLAWAMLLLPNALNLFWMGPVTTAVQHLVGRSARSTASASFLFINNLIGLGAGPLLMGWMSDQLKVHFGREALRYAAVSCLGFYFMASLLILLAVRPLRRDWVEDNYPPCFGSGDQR